MNRMSTGARHGYLTGPALLLGSRVVCTFPGPRVKLQPFARARDEQLLTQLGQQDRSGGDRRGRHHRSRRQQHSFGTAPENGL